MVRSLKTRLTALEESASGSSECLECGNGPDDGDTYEIVFVEPGDTTPDEWCQTCGRALSLTIHMDWGGSA